MHWFFLFLASLSPFLAQFIGATVSRVAVAIGFATVSYFGIGLLFDSVIEHLNSSVSPLPQVILTFIHLLGIDTAINIFLSAGLALVVLKGVNKTDHMRKQVWRKPGDRMGDWGSGGA